MLRRLESSSLFFEALADDMLGEYIAKLIIRRVTGLEVEHLVIEQQKVVNGLDTALEMQIVTRTEAVGEQEFNKFLLAFFSFFTYN